MIVRTLDINHDWEFGKGRNDYLSNNDAIVQMVNTRLNSFLGDCFFASDAGIDWFNLLGSKNRLAIELSVRAVILNTEGVVSLVRSETVLDSLTRVISMNYTITTIFSAENNVGEITSSSSFLLTESGDVLTTEDGSGIELG